jgi:hypothetical protein
MEQFKPQHLQWVHHQREPEVTDVASQVMVIEFGCRLGKHIFPIAIASCHAQHQAIPSSTLGPGCF